MLMNTASSLPNVHTHRRSTSTQRPEMLCFALIYYLNCKLTFTIHCSWIKTARLQSRNMLKKRKCSSKIRIQSPRQNSGTSGFCFFLFSGAFELLNFHSICAESKGLCSRCVSLWAFFHLETTRRLKTKIQSC